MDSEVGRVYLTADVRDLDKVRQQVEELRRLASQANQGGGIPTPIGGVAGSSRNDPFDALRQQGATEAEIKKFAGNRYVPPPSTGGGIPPPTPPAGGGGSSGGGGTGAGDPIGRGGGRMPRPGAPKTFAEMLDEGRGGGRMPRSAAPATFEDQLANARGAPGMMFAMQRKGHEELAEAQKKLAKESKDAAGHVSQFGLRTAWVLRSATGGGPMGMVGGGVGALAGLAFGNPAFGALMGNMAGRKMGDAASTLGGWAGMASPATGYNIDLAGRDMRAAIGRPFTSAVDYAASKMRQVGDAAVANEKGLSQLSRVFISTSEGIFHNLGINALLGTETGKSRGAAFSPLQGQVFGSADEVYHAIAGITMKMRPEQVDKDAETENERQTAIWRADIDRGRTPPGMLRMPEQREMMGVTRGAKPQKSGYGINEDRVQRIGETQDEFLRRISILDGVYSPASPMIGPPAPTQRELREAEVEAGARPYRNVGQDILDHLSAIFIGPPVMY